MTIKSAWPRFIILSIITGQMFLLIGFLACSDSENGTGPDDGDTTIVEKAPEISSPSQPIDDIFCSGRMACISLPITNADSIMSSQGGTWGNNTLCWSFTGDFVGVDTVIAVNSYGADTCVLHMSMTLNEGPEISCPFESIQEIVFDGETICVYLPITGTDSVISSQDGTWDNDTLCWVFTEEFTGIDTVIAVNSCSADTCVLEVSGNVLPVKDYDGTLRLYVVEPISRWVNDNDSIPTPYHFGFLDFALDSAIMLTGSTQVSLDITWDGPASGWDSITEDNIKVIAALFNSESHQAYAYPEKERNPFQAYYVDATAAAVPGTTDSNNSSQSTTHTVFVEEVTATWCFFCPTTRDWLYEVYEQGYNFHYVALVGDMNSTAYNRLKNEYNYYGYPSTFIDGGNKVLTGGWSPAEPYINLIEAAGSREVRDIDLVISVDWLGEGKIRIAVSVEI